MTYDTGGTVHQDENDVVTYGRDQVVEAGRFTLQANDLRRLWEAIDEVNFFSLTEDYRMQLGLSYAFIMVEADGRRHQVFNIGIEFPEIRTIMETVDTMLPEGINLEYGVGYSPYPPLTQYRIYAAKLGRGMLDADSLG